MAGPHRPYRGLGLCPWHHPRLPASFTELGFIGNGPDAKKNAKCHIFILLLFVFFTHVAMVFGMVDPRLGGYEVSAPMHQDMQMNPGFQHGAMMDGARQGGPQQGPMNGSYGCGQNP